MSKNSDHNAFYQIDAMPDFPQRRKSIPLVTDLVNLIFNIVKMCISRLYIAIIVYNKAMAMAANKRSTGVPAGRQTLNDEELVCVLFF